MKLAQRSKPTFQTNAQTNAPNERSNQRFRFSGHTNQHQKASLPIMVLRSHYHSNQPTKQTIKTKSHLRKHANRFATAACVGMLAFGLGNSSSPAKADQLFRENTDLPERDLGGNRGVVRDFPGNYESYVFDIPSGQNIFNLDSVNKLPIDICKVEGGFGQVDLLGSPYDRDDFFRFPDLPPGWTLKFNSSLIGDIRSQSGFQVVLSDSTDSFLTESYVSQGVPSTEMDIVVPSDGVLLTNIIPSGEGGADHEFSNYQISFSVTAVPEPASSAALLALGAAGLLGRRRKEDTSCSE